MAYSYTTFGAVTLPTYNRVADMSPAAALPRVIQTLGGAPDLDGSAQAAQVWPHPLTVEAIIWDSTAALLKTAIDALRALVSTHAYLTRQAKQRQRHPGAGALPPGERGNAAVARARAGDSAGRAEFPAIGALGGDDGQHNWTHYGQLD